MDLEYIFGLMVASMKACGKMENNMEKGNTHLLMAHQEEEFGKMARELNGLMR